jgi:hypothetical protein
VVAIGVGILRSGGFGGGAGSTTSLSQGGSVYAPAQAPYRPQTAFGPLPVPGPPRSAGQDTATSPGAASYTWTGHLNLGITTAPVFRYFEPSAATADQFAASLGASLVSRSGNYLGHYASTGLQVQVRGSNQVPPLEPFFNLIPAAHASPSSGIAPLDVANSYLGALSLAPAWPYTIATDTSGGVTRVRYLRQFDVPSYGPAYLVDSSGDSYGLEVDVKGGQPVVVAGPLPLGLDSANYPIISADQAVSMALATQTAPAGAPNTVSVQLDKAELVYVLVVAGDHSFYEPAILLSGTFGVNGQSYTKHVLIPAVDPSQRTP